MKAKAFYSPLSPVYSLFSFSATPKMGVTGIEPAHLTVLDPKSSASASSATLPRACKSISVVQDLSRGNSVHALLLQTQPATASAAH